MQEIFIPPESYSPRVEFNTNGKLLLEGRSMPEDVFKLFSPLVEFASEINVDTVDFDINLEYFNTSTSKKILELLRALDNNTQILKLNVIWHYEAGDEDSLEMAEIYNEFLNRAQFYFQEHETAVTLSNRFVQYNIS